MSWLKFLLWPEPNDLITALEAQVVELKARLQAAELENELLGEVNENLRKWMQANTAAAAGIVNAMTSPEESLRRSRA